MPSAANVISNTLQTNDPSADDAQNSGRFIRCNHKDIDILLYALQHQWAYETVKFVIYLHEISEGSPIDWQCPIKLTDLWRYIVSHSK